VITPAGWAKVRQQRPFAFELRRYTHTLGMALLSYTPHHWVIRRIPQLALAEDGWC
jgi:hypothetical protein